MKYSEETKKQCIKVRHAFGTSYLEFSLFKRHKYWVDFVNNFNLFELSEFEKETCIKEFLNPKDIKKRYSKGK